MRVVFSLTRDEPIGLLSSRSFCRDNNEIVITVGRGEGTTGDVAYKVKDSTSKITRLWCLFRRNFSVCLYEFYPLVSFVAAISKKRKKEFCIMRLPLPILATFGATLSLLVTVSTCTQLIIDGVLSPPQF